MKEVLVTAWKDVGLLSWRKADPEVGGMHQDTLRYLYILCSTG